VEQGSERCVQSKLIWIKFESPWRGRDVPLLPCPNWQIGCSAWQWMDRGRGTSFTHMLLTAQL
jgi:hypothetical protein